MTLEYGQTFLLSKYIKNYTKSDNAELVMPESTKMDAIGDQTMIYQIKNGYKTETFELNVHTVDTQTPVITLNTHDVTLTKGVDVFTAEAYPQYKLFKIDIVFSAVSCVFKIMNSHIFNILAS